MHQYKFKSILLVAGLGMIALLNTTPVWAEEASLVATANSTIVVNTTGETTLTLVPSTTVLAGKYTTQVTLANWSASTTVGSLAFRFNPIIMKASPTSPSVGTATSKENSSNTIPVVISTFIGGTGGTTCSNESDIISIINGWSVCNQGLLSSGGFIKTTNATNTIVPGTYPLSMDAAIWAY